MSNPIFRSDSRLMLFAPHPDDESLACSVLLQRAVKAGATVAVVYGTDGEDNPWPHRVLERKWSLRETDRARWGQMRREEALAALVVLGIHPADVHFLALPDQKLTTVLMNGCAPVVALLADAVAKFAPTDLVVPSLTDTHPDHSAFAVMLRLAMNQNMSVAAPIRLWSYAVHGRSRVFSAHARALVQAPAETEIKRQAIACHRSQTKLSRRRFFAYATRPERFDGIAEVGTEIFDPPVSSALRFAKTIHLAFELPIKSVRANAPALRVIGTDVTGTLRCLEIDIPLRWGLVKIRDVQRGEELSLAEYRGNKFAGEIVVPALFFSNTAPIFVKLERRGWFFDEAGWFELPPVSTAAVVTAERVASVA